MPEFAVQIAPLAHIAGPTYTRTQVVACTHERALRGALLTWPESYPEQVSALVVRAFVPTDFAYVPEMRVPCPDWHRPAPPSRNPLPNVDSDEPEVLAGERAREQAEIERAVRWYYEIPEELPLDLSWDYAGRDPASSDQRYTAMLAELPAGHPDRERDEGPMPPIDRLLLEVRQTLRAGAQISRPAPYYYVYSEARIQL